MDSAVLEMMISLPAFTLVLAIVYISSCTAFSFNHNTVKTSPSKSSTKSSSASLLSILLLSSSLLTSFNVPVSNAAVTDEASINRFRKMYTELKELDENWDSIVKGEGDNVRRRLGTVFTPSNGCTSSLCSPSQFVNRFVKQYGTDVDDFNAFEEASQSLLESLNQADFLAYSAVFSEYGNGGGGNDYLQSSKAKIESAITNVDIILKEITK